jgi:hypothetical protein
LARLWTLAVGVGLLLMFGWIVGREARNARQLDDLHRLVLEQTGRLDTFAHQQQILTALATRLALVERSTPALVAVAPTGASPPACECPAAAAVREPTPGALVVAPAEAAAALVHTRQLFEGALTRGRWTEQDRTDFRSERWKVPPAEAEALVESFLAAVNLGKVDVRSLHGDLF